MHLHHRVLGLVDLRFEDVLVALKLLGRGVGTLALVDRRKLLGVSSADSAGLFAMLQDHVTRLENMVRGLRQTRLLQWTGRRAKWQFDTLRGSCARHLTRLHC